MNFLRKLLSRTRWRAGGDPRMRGLSTAELVGIILIVGVLGALGGSYMGSLVGTANTSSGKQNAQSLNDVLSAAFAAGAIGDDGTHAPGMIDLTSTANAIAQLSGAGVTVNGILFKMNSVTVTPSSYTLNGSSAPTASFTYNGNGVPP